MLQISQELTALASHLARSHIESHPELIAVLDHNGVPSFAAGNSTTSTNSSSSDSPQIRPSEPNSPRGPQSGPSSGHAPVSEISLDSAEPEPVLGIPSDSSEHASVPGIPSDATDHAPVTGIPADLSDHALGAEILIPEEHAPVSETSSDHVPSSGRSNSDSGPETSRAQSPSPAPVGNGHTWIPTALFGRPEPSTRPSNPRQSNATLAERPVIVDDIRGLREEYRRPRREPVSSW